MFIYLSFIICKYKELALLSTLLNAWIHLVLVIRLTKNSQNASVNICDVIFLEICKSRETYTTMLDVTDCVQSQVPFAQVINKESVVNLIRRHQKE